MGACIRSLWLSGFGFGEGRHCGRDLLRAFVSSQRPAGSVGMGPGVSGSLEGGQFRPLTFGLSCAVHLFQKEEEVAVKKHPEGKIDADMAAWHQTETKPFSSACCPAPGALAPWVDVLSHRDGKASVLFCNLCSGCLNITRQITPLAVPAKQMLPARIYHTWVYSNLKTPE